jgi:alcohol dehydrogenase
MALADEVFGFYMPTINLGGVGAAKEVGAQAKLLGTGKVLIVTDPVLDALGMAGQIVDQLAGAGVDSVVYTGAAPNPTDINVHDGVEVYRESGCDGLISLGGGSAHDCAKGIGFVVAGGGHIRDYEGLDRSTEPFPPFLAINTTSGTASEMTRFCIITNTDTRVKMAIVDWRCTPRVSVNDPVLMAGQPPALTAATGMDALTHAIEAYVSTIATPITDSAAVAAMELIARYLSPAVANGTDMVARDRMAYAEFLAGMAFNNASLGYVHAMAHQLGGLYDLPHGVCNAVLLPHVCEFNLIARPERFAEIAVRLGQDITGLDTAGAGRRGIEAIRALSRSLGIPGGLTEMGVREEDLPLMATNAMKDACALTNPRTATHEEIVEVFRAAM